MAITDQDIRFKADVFKHNKQLKFTDRTDYQDQSIGNDRVVGLIKITDPISGEMYKNSGYDSNNYSAPDICIPANRDNKDQINFSLDSLGEILNGNYNIDYKIRSFVFNSEISHDCDFTSADKKIVINGIGTANGQKIIDSGFAAFIGGLVVGTFTLAGGSFFTGDDLTIFVLENIPDASDTEDIEIYDQDGDFSSSRTFKYCYNSPVISIGYDLSCITSTLTSKDTTNYNVKNCTNEYSPGLLTRVHSVQAPIGSDFGTIPDSSDEIRTFVGIWTRTWQSSITSTLRYDIELWDDAYWYIINDVVSGEDNVDVKCDDCQCKILPCVIALYDKWKKALSNNPQREKELRVSVIKVSSLINQYQQSKSCGENTDSICEELKHILSLENCVCAEDSDDASKYVIPISSSSLLTPLFGNDNPPSDSIGQDGQLYFVKTGDNPLYQKVDGVWVFQFNTKGDKGDQGASGPAGISTTQVTTHNISFEDREIGTTGLEFNFNATILRVRFITTRLIDAVDNGSAVMNIDAGPPIYTATYTAGSQPGEEVNSYSTPFSILSGQVLGFTTSKPTQGGRGEVQITYTQANE